MRAKLQNFLRSYDLSLTSTNAPLLRDMQPRAKVPTQTQMPFRTKRQHLRLAATLAFLPSLFLTGCEDIQFWKDKEGAVSVYGTHHQEPDDKGKIPDAGSTSFRSFTSNVGWEIQLTSAFVVTAETDLAPCMSMSSDEERAGGEIPADTSKLTSVNMTCGSCSENFIGKPDKTPFSLSRSLSVPAGNYCMLRVAFAPRAGESADSSDSSGESSSSENTLELRGIARKGSKEVSFSVKYDDEYLAELDISRIDRGKPFSVPDSGQPVKLTISKVYDRFFDDVDFSSSSYKTQLADSVAHSLEQLSYVTQGESPGPRPDPNQDDTSSGEDTSGDTSGSDDSTSDSSSY